jgi:hypothetical protein
MFVTIINNCLDNNVISHVQSCVTSNLTWIKLIKLFQFQNVVTKMYLKDKFHTLKGKSSIHYDELFSMS